jgi:predicted phosphodiesterase
MATGERLAIIADIHANIWALDAVLNHAKNRGATAFLNLGDILYGPLKPRATFERIMKENVLFTIQGNQDRHIFDASETDRASHSTLAYAIDDLGSEPIEWMRQLPKTGVFEDEIFLCHGTPESDTTYLLEDVSSGSPMIRSESEILTFLGAAEQRVVLCGHSHIPRFVELANEQTIVNPGSVGLPAYSDDSPVPHAMETFSPRASYAILDRGPEEWNVSFYRVLYDHYAAAEQAKSLGRDDWAQGIATGRM